MKEFRNVFISILLVVISTILIGCETITVNQDNPDKLIPEAISETISGAEIGSEESSTDEIGEEEYLPEGIMKVHFIDVDQGDSILIESAGNFMLVDGGENDQGENVISYLKEQGVTKLDYVIGTHPHSDHIGGIDNVIETFEIGKVILPEKEHLTITFEEVLDAIKNKGLSITKAVVGETYDIGNGEFVIIGPNDDYGDDLNNWSVGIKLTFGENSFVMYGDAEIVAEYDMMENGIDLSADVLKLSHHGSSTSSSQGIINAVAPSYVVISVGKDNSYGHPHDETLARLEDRNIEVYRTDEEGTVVAISDGKEIVWDFQKTINSVGNIDSADANNDYPDSTAAITYEYIANKNSKAFHYPECDSVSKMKDSNKEYITGTRNDAIDMGYEPCGNCKP